ncbi:hypothetical protein F0237_07265 [Vibrio tubiashii]|uniref:RelA/SpoT domain-containing protein n=1 Tax=Vibrio tubiashii TaxID=29498 RepID=A0AAE5LHH7_9VIBR|nr:hypothetical protein [Vibrio tubiashii]NOI80457.1 hypothetical protein [Vibrio tubiashii]
MADTLVASVGSEALGGAVTKKMTVGDVAKVKAEVLKRINQSAHLSQGFRLVNQTEYQSSLAELRAQLKSKSFQETEEGKMCKLMHDILTDDAHLVEYLDEDLSQYLETNTAGKQVLNTKAMDFHGKNQVANAKLKRKQLFLMFKEIIQAQVELNTFAERLKVAFGAEVSFPPGAYGGIKSYSGALAKITTRVRANDVGDLKDCARITVKVKRFRDLQSAKLFICGTEEFKAVATHQKALKDRYQLARGGSNLEQHNVAPDSSGYKDIKFFLKMSNGQIAELQLNIPGMLIAKKKAHIVYDIARTNQDSFDNRQQFEVVSQEVIDKVKKKMDEDWFQFIRSKLDGVDNDANCVEAMMDVLKSKGTLVVEPKHAEALNRISKKLYAAGLGEALLDT